MNTSSQTPAPESSTQSSSSLVGLFPMSFAPVRRFDTPGRAMGISPLKRLAEPMEKYSFLGASQIDILVAPSRESKRLFPHRGVGIIYDASSAGTSFLALDLACSISEGRPGFGNRTLRSPVIYLSLEGSAGFAMRTEDWEEANGRPLPDMLRLVIEPASLLENENMQRLLGTYAEWTKSLPSGIGPPVIVVDTLNRAMPGADDGGSAKVGSALTACALMSEGTMGLTILVHHVR